MKDYNQVIEEMKEQLNELPSVSLNNLDAKKTALIVVDMVNGFAKEGILSSPRVKNIIPKVKDLVLKAKENKIEVIYFTDVHNNVSPECDRLGKHCLDDTSESEVVDEIKGLEDKLIKKNSTNGFFEENFAWWFGKKRSEINNYIIVGCVTDICVYNFATSLRAYMDKVNNVNAEVFVPINCVETYDYDKKREQASSLLRFTEVWRRIAFGLEIVILL